MTEARSAFLLLCIIFETQSMETPSKISLTKAEVGDNVTLKCSTTGVDKNLLSWFKYELGYVIKTVGTRSYENVKIDGQFNSSRFSIITKADGFSLIIRNVSKEDEATYLCQAGSYLTMRFLNGSHLVVKDPTKKQNVIHVDQSSDVEPIFLGKTGNMQCSVQSKIWKNPDQCLGEHRVYWYKAGSESHADIIQATSPSCDDHEQRCVYSLFKTKQNFSDSGVSSCAVVSCGQILFGERTQMQMKQHVFLYLIILGTLLACSILVNITLIFIIRKGCCKHTKDAAAQRPRKQEKSADDEPTNLDDEEAELHYAALKFPRKTKNLRSANEFTEDPF